MRTSARSDWQLPGLRVRPEPVPDVAAKFDLTLAFRQDRDAGGAPAGISASFEYAADLFDPATVQALAARLTRLLRQAAADPARPLSALDLLTAAERRELARLERHRAGDTGGDVAGAVRGAGGPDPGRPRRDLRRTPRCPTPS